MDKIKLALVGGGGMGTRHLYGLRELAKTPFNNVELCALCDIRRNNAEIAATEAESLLGPRPQVFTDLEDTVRSIPGLSAVDVVTDPSVHHAVVCKTLDLGLHVLVEKPMAISVRACHIDAKSRRTQQPQAVRSREFPPRSLGASGPPPPKNGGNRQPLYGHVPCAA